MSALAAEFLRFEAGCSLSLHGRPNPTSSQVESEPGLPVMSVVVAPLIRSMCPRRIARIERCISRANGTAIEVDAIPEGFMIRWSSPLDWRAAQALAKRVERHLFEPLPPKRVAAVYGLMVSDLKDLPISPSAKRLGERYGKRYSYELYSLEDVQNIAVFLADRPLNSYLSIDRLSGSKCQFLLEFLKSDE